MNRMRRKTINSIYERLYELRNLLEEVKDEEEEYRDNIPENLQGSERYIRTDEILDDLDSAISSLEETLDYLESAAE